MVPPCGNYSSGSWAKCWYYGHCHCNVWGIHCPLSLTQKPGLLPTSMHLWQANLLAGEQGTILVPSGFLTLFCLSIRVLRCFHLNLFSSFFLSTGVTGGNREKEAGGQRVHWVPEGKKNRPNKWWERALDREKDASGSKNQLNPLHSWAWGPSCCQPASSVLFPSVAEGG